MVRTPNSLARRRVWYTVSSGISSCSTIQPAERSRSADASMSAGRSRSFAPFTTRMRFWPELSTKMGATPLDTPGVIITREASMPRAWKFWMVAGPNRSSPTRATIETLAPHNRAATAWLAPLPPKPRWNSRPKMVSPGRGNWSVKVVRSTFALPTTTM